MTFLNIKIPDRNPHLAISSEKPVAAPTESSSGPLPCTVENKLNFKPIDASHFINSSIEPRHWLIPTFSLLGYISMIVAAGATGKSSLSIVMAISVATGRDLLGFGKTTQSNVLLINNEDDYKELQRRVSGIAHYYDVKDSEPKGKLFIQSGYDSKVVFANEHDGEVISGLHLQEVENFIIEQNIKLLVIDPFVSIHQCNENDNVKMDAVVSILKGIAGKNQVSIIIIHHTPKVRGSKISGDAEMARGASAVKDACRIVFTLENLSEETAEDYSIPFHEINRVKLLQDAKTNFSLATNTPVMLYMESVTLANGEEIGVPRRYNKAQVIKDEKPNPEQVKSRVILDIAQAMLNKVGANGGIKKATEIYPEYMKLSGYSKSKTESNFSLLPKGTSKSQELTYGDLSYQIYQTKEKGQTTARYVHLEIQN